MAAVSKSWLFLESIGVSACSRSTVAFDPGCDPLTFESHLKQSGHLLLGVKLSMATWQLASEEALHYKILAARHARLPLIAGGGAFEVANAFAKAISYFDLCAEVGFSRIEIGEGFTEGALCPPELVRQVHERGMTVQFEIGHKLRGMFKEEEMKGLCDKARLWLQAGAEQIVVEAREDAVDVGVFGPGGELNRKLVDLLVASVDNDLGRIQFEAPTKQSQFCLLEHFGAGVVLSNVRLEEILRLEVFRRGLHSRSFAIESLRPLGPKV